MAPPDQLHKAMVGELFLVFLVYLYFFLKFPKQYGPPSSNKPKIPKEKKPKKGKKGEQPEQPNDQSNQQAEQAQIDLQLEANKQQLEVADKPVEKVVDPNVRFTEQLFIYFTQIGAAFYAPFAFEIAIAWIHLP
eukprot:CAMPEP_0176448720 /NCGR_PEP_ID=MMETSP0127-20121128/25985_1 /TAXON_ID=938130 /ORGANISM="Platyophrya macrostoma, Strain WH" /LENGTH=133 /DNA_ID=CAMNT_0017835791 /DNA_START=33 /DNA_END=430 /DNA_ORIENTATION=+